MAWKGGAGPTAQAPPTISSGVSAPSKGCVEGDDGNGGEERMLLLHDKHKAASHCSTHCFVILAWPLLVSVPPAPHLQYLHH